MNLTLKPKWEEFVQQQVKTGRYASPEDVIAAGLIRLMQDDDSDFEPGELAALAQQGEDSIAQGDTVTMQELRERFRLRHERHNK